MQKNAIFYTWDAIFLWQIAIICQVCMYKWNARLFASRRGFIELPHNKVFLHITSLKIWLNQQVTTFESPLLPYDFKNQWQWSPMKWYIYHAFVTMFSTIIFVDILGLIKNIAIPVCICIFKIVNTKASTGYDINAFSPTNLREPYINTSIFSLIDV